MNYQISSSKKFVDERGFSLVELLIVIAVLGVLAVLAFNSFAGIIFNSKRKADTQQAKRIEFAINTFVTSTGIIDLTSQLGNFSIDQSTVKYYATNKDGISDLIKDLQSPIYVKDRKSNKWVAYGPFLDSHTGEATYSSFAPQWKEEFGGSHTGYLLRINKLTNLVNCMPVTGTTETAPTTYDTSSNPGILIQN